MRGALAAERRAAPRGQCGAGIVGIRAVLDARGELARGPAASRSPRAAGRPGEGGGCAVRWPPGTPRLSPAALPAAAAHTLVLLPPNRIV